MRRPRALLLSWPLTLGLLLVVPTSSIAQYMYLDTNGDGAWSPDDALAIAGQTDVDIWLITDHNRDGSEVQCTTNDALMTINSYGIFLHATAGTIGWGGFVNRVPEFESLHFGASTSTDFFVMYLSATILPPGRYLLGTLAVTIASGTPTLSFGTRGRVGSQNAGTWFGCACLGPDEDNTIKFGRTWFDADGLPYRGPNNAPVLAQPVDMVLNEGTEASQDVAAVDAEGSSVTFSLAAGPSFVSVTTQDPSPTGAVGRVRLNPGFADVGSYQVTVGVTDGALEGSRSFTAHVLDVTLPPRFEFPAGRVFCAERGYPSEYVILATDPDHDALRVETTALPAWARFVDNGDNSGRLTLEPAESEATGDTPVTFRVTDGAFDRSVEAVLSVRESFDCFPGSSPFVSGGAPVAVAGGPYHAVAGEAVRLDGGASYDPDGSPLEYSWSLGDGMSAIGRVVVHAYERGGEFRGVLRVTSGGLARRDTASVEIAPPYVGRAFTPPGFEILPLRSGRPTFCARLEATSAYSIADVSPASLRLFSAGTGDVEEIAATPGKAMLLGDSNHNNTPDLEVCFAQADLQRLFQGVRGKHTLACALRGRLNSGAKVEAPILITVIGAPSRRTVAVTPNPLNPGGALQFEVERSGPVRVRLFDLSGRLVRTLLDEPLRPGLQSVSIDGRDQGGNAMASGIYFFRVETVEGVKSGRFTILK